MWLIPNLRTFNSLYILLGCFAYLSIKRWCG